MAEDDTGCDGRGRRRIRGKPGVTLAMVFFIICGREFQRAKNSARIERLEGVGLQVPWSIRPNRSLGTLLPCLSSAVANGA
jgi:hypothetical protein